MTRQRTPSKQTRQVLRILSEAPDKGWYGYDLCKRTGLKSGTLYPILMRLSDQGYLESEWQESEQPGRPPRHVYRLSASGKALAHALAAGGAAAPGALATDGAAS